MAVRPGWLLPALALGGLGAGVKGLTMLQAVSSARTFCHALATIGSLLPRGLRTTANCAPFDSRYDWGLAIALIGLLAVIVGGAGLARRSDRAARAGCPWPLRRATRSAAGWVDAHLPGTKRSEPRLRPGYLTALAAILTTVAVGAGLSAWSDHRRAQHLGAYNETEHVLVSLRLPSSIGRDLSRSCGAPVCGHSRLSPPQLEPALRRLLHAAPNPTLTALLPPCAGPCPVTLDGHLNGYPVVAIAFWHPLPVKHQRPPSGALSFPHRGGHLFYLGSDVTIDAVSPDPGN